LGGNRKTRKIMRNRGRWIKFKVCKGDRCL
jgi:hypothetical protein